MIGGFILDTNDAVYINSKINNQYNKEQTKKKKFNIHIKRREDK